MYFLLALRRLNFISLILGSLSTTTMVALPPLPTGFSFPNFPAPISSLQNMRLTRDMLTQRHGMFVVLIQNEKGLCPLAGC